jgi:hypothetical protein
LLLSWPEGGDGVLDLVVNLIVLKKEKMVD